MIHICWSSTLWFLKQFIFCFPFRWEIYTSAKYWNHEKRLFCSMDFFSRKKVVCVFLIQTLAKLKSELIALLSRWVSVVEFHDPTFSIGKVFGQESTVVKWNYQILGLHQVTVCQKLGVILVIKWFKNWSQQKMLLTKKVRLNWYSSMNFF